jgi:hypothetical protein
MINLSLILLAIVLLTVIGVAILVAPANPSLGYWFGLGWVLLLVFANWFTSTLIFGKAKKTKAAGGTIFGIIPIISIIVLLYSAASIIVLIMYMNNLIGSTTHLLFQILALSLVSIITVLSLLAVKGAQEDTIASVSTVELITSIDKICRRTNDDDSLKRLEDLKSYLLYRMPPPKYIDQSILLDGYLKLSSLESHDFSLNELNVICKTIENA